MSLKKDCAGSLYYILDYLYYILDYLDMTLFLFMVHAFPSQGKSTAKFMQIRGVFFIPEEVVRSASSAGFIYKYVIYTEKIFRELRPENYWESISPLKQTRNYVNRCFSIEKIQGRAHGMYS